MGTKTGLLERFWRRTSATLMTMSVFTIAAGCVATQWVPLTQAPPKADQLWLDVEVLSDSTSTAGRKMTLYQPRMEDDSVLVGTQVVRGRAMGQERVRAANALVRVSHVRALPTVGLLAGVALVVGAIVHHLTDESLCCVVR